MNGDSTHSDQEAPTYASTTKGTQYVVHHEFGGTTELTTTLAHAISDVTGIDVTNAEFRLYDYVDAEALNRLFRPKPDGTLRAKSSYEFEIWNCRVTVLSSGQITIVPLSWDHEPPLQPE